MLCAWSPPSRHSLLGQLKNLGFLCALIYPLYVDLDQLVNITSYTPNYFELCSGICGPFFLLLLEIFVVQLQWFPNIILDFKIFCPMVYMLVALFMLLIICWFSHSRSYLFYRRWALCCWGSWWLLGLVVGLLFLWHTGKDCCLVYDATWPCNCYGVLLYLLC